MAKLDDGLTFFGWVQPPDVPPDPTGEEWRGLPGEPGQDGATGPAGPSGGYVPITLTYTATAGQTVLNLTTLDMAGSTYTLSTINHELLDVYVNGVRLASSPSTGGAGDWSVDYPTSMVTLTAPLKADDLVQITVAMPTSQEFILSTYLPIAGGTMLGPLNYIATGSTTARSMQDRAAVVANVLDFGADPTGFADSTAAIRAAIATGRNVWLPAGAYRVTGRLNLGSLTKAQAIYGDGSGTTLLIDATFDPAVGDGVIVLPDNNQNTARASVSNLVFHFAQPDDVVTTATAMTAAGTNTITVASAAGILVGMAVLNWTHTTSIQTATLNTSRTVAVVSSIAGNVITLDRNIAAPGVSISDEIHFAATRAMFKSLAAGGTATPGGTGIQYPWAIYATLNAASVLITDVRIIGAWNGVYVRGSAFQIHRLDVGAFNVGLDLDNCANFPSLIDYRFWSWGYGPRDPHVQTGAALLNVYYDGGAIAANIGKAEGLAATNFQSWAGQLNLTAGWKFGQFDNLSLDGNNANLNITSTVNAGWVKISNFYSSKGQHTIGDQMVVAPTMPNFTVLIDNLQLGGASTTYRGITQSNGRLTIVGAILWHGLAATRSFIELSGGDLQLSNAQLDASAARTDTYIHTSGGAIQLSDCAFVAAAGAGGKGIVIDADNPLNFITDIVWNGWGQTFPAGSASTNPLNMTRTSAAFSVPVTMLTTYGSQLKLGAAAQAGRVDFARGDDGSFLGWVGMATAVSRDVGMANGSGNPVVFLDAANTGGRVSLRVNAAERLAVVDGGVVLGSNTGSVPFIVGINAAINTVRRFQFQSAGVVRFEMILANNETGSGNVGADFRIGRYDDAGTLLGNPVLINRSTGAITFDAANIAIGSSGPTIRSGTGAATGTQPKGSIWMRTDGAAGSTLYVTQGGGVWAPVAGV
jgi:hypothetical protein